MSSQIVWSSLKSCHLISWPSWTRPNLLDNKLQRSALVLYHCRFTPTHSERNFHGTRKVDGRASFWRGTLIYSCMPKTFLIFPSHIHKSLFGNEAKGILGQEERKKTMRKDKYEIF
jgi:hypothetical protein